MTEATQRIQLLRAIAVILGLQGLAVLAYLYVENRRQADEQPAFRSERLEGRPPLPAVDLVRPDGSLLHTADLRQEPVLLHFWATWCPPCRKELPGLLRLGRDEANLEVVALTLDTDWAVVRRFFGGTIPPEVVRDPSGKLAKVYEVGTLPDTYLLDRNGAATLRFAGAREWSDPGARAALASLVVER